MEPVLWFVGFMVLMIVVAIIKNALNPPRDLDWQEVPSKIREVVTSVFSEFEVDSSRYIPVARKYKIRGQYRGRSVEIEVEGSSDGSIRELELEDLERGQMMRSKPYQFEELPAAVADHLSSLIGPDLASLHCQRLSKGTFNGEPAFSLNGRTQNATWEVEITETGRLIEVEMSPRK